VCGERRSEPAGDSEVDVDRGLGRGGEVEGVEGAARAPADRGDNVCGQVGASGVFDDFAVEEDLGLDDSAEDPCELDRGEMHGVRVAEAPRILLQIGGGHEGQNSQEFLSSSELWRMGRATPLARSKLRDAQGVQGSVWWQARGLTPELPPPSLIWVFGACCLKEEDGHEAELHSVHGAPEALDEVDRAHPERHCAVRKGWRCGGFDQSLDFIDFESHFFESHF